MKVNEKIAELNLGTSLLVVMGSHHGIVYKIENDEVSKVGEHRVDVPVYSDNEGMHQRGGGDSPSYGSVLEPKKQIAQEEFLKEFTKKVQDLCALDTIKSIYLFAPLENKGLIDADWTTEMKELVEERFHGNYTSKQPSELLEMVHEGISSKKEKVPTGEAKEILDKTKNVS